MTAECKQLAPSHLEAIDMSSANLVKLAHKHECKFLALQLGVSRAEAIDDVLISSNWPENILAGNRNFLPVLNYELSHKISRTIVPFQWAYEIADSASKANANDELLDLLYQFHSSECWAIPVHGPRGSLGLVVIGELTRDLAPAEIAAFQAASFELFNHHFKNSENSLLNNDRLSKTEIKILQMMIDGRSAAEISASSGLSPFSVESYTKNAKSKLNSTTKIQAVAQAIRNGEIG